MPSLEQSGYKGSASELWWGVLAAAGTPQPIVDRLNAEITKVLSAPDVKDRLHAQGFEIVTSTPEQFGTYIRTEIVKWAKVVKASGAKIDN